MRNRFIYFLFFFLVVFSNRVTNIEASSMQWSEFSFMLKPSALGGVGVFATHDIAKGTILFEHDFEIRTMKVKDIPTPLLQYCIYISDDECLCPEQFDRMEIGWYINHSSTPNIAKQNKESHSEAVRNIKERRIHAIEDIKAGDEIFIDYNGLDEPEHLKEDYYRKK